MDREAAAQREGHLVVYASLRGVILSLVTAFRKHYKHLHIHLHFLSSHPIPIYEKVKAEINAGLHTADVVILPHYMVLQMAAEGLTRPYKSAEFRAFPQEFYSEKNGWAAMAVEPIGMIYNAQQLRDYEAPLTSGELLDKKWSGQVATQSVTSFSEGMMGAYYLIALKRGMGESRWMDFLRGLGSKVSPVTYECLLHMSHAIARGEQKIGFPATLRKASLADAAEGGPVETLHLLDLPDTASPRTMAVLKHGRHPNVAELFFDFALSREWQNEMGEKLDGMVPARPGVETRYWVSKPLTTGLLYFPTVDEVSQLKQYVEVFREMGLR
ncbi:MAG: ABC transporter substrate-binding protein [Candidatus Caldarchaeum sp.]